MYLIACRNTVGIYNVLFYMFQNIYFNSLNVYVFSHSNNLITERRLKTENKINGAPKLHIKDRKLLNNKNDSMEKNKYEPVLESEFSLGTSS